MSDPFSIAAGVIALVGQCIRGIQTVTDAITEYQNADITMITLRTQCTSFAFVLKQVRHHLELKGSALVIDRDGTGQLLRDRFAEAFSTSTIVFTILNQNLQEYLSASRDQHNKLAVSSKAKIVWNKGEIEKIEKNIQSLTGTVGLLMQCLVLYGQSKEKAQSILSSKQTEKMFRNALNDARSLQTSRNSINSAEDTDYSLLGSASFEFDDICLNSAAYRRAFRSRVLREEHAGSFRSPSKAENENMPEGSVGNKNNSHHSVAPTKKRIVQYFTAFKIGDRTGLKSRFKLEQIPTFRTERHHREGMNATQNSDPDGIDLKVRSGVKRRKRRKYNKNNAEVNATTGSEDLERQNQSSSDDERESISSSRSDPSSLQSEIPIIHNLDSAEPGDSELCEDDKLMSSHTVRALDIEDSGELAKRVTDRIMRRMAADYPDIIKWNDEAREKNDGATQTAVNVSRTCRKPSTRSIRRVRRPESLRSCRR